jgi:endoglucanase
VRYSVLMMSVALLVLPAPGQYREPSGGLYPTTLVLFRDEVTPGVNATPWGARLSIDTKEKRLGTASWRWEVEPVSGAHLMWGSFVQDTTVFWVHQNSHVSFWVRSSDEGVSISVQLGYMDGQFDLVTVTPLGPANLWRYFDLLVPREAIGRHLNDLKIIIHARRPGTVIHFDEIKITDVRLYAGKGIPMPISGVFASQVGYDTKGIKTFSAEPFTHYEIVQTSNNQIAYKGTDKRMVSSRLINDRAAYIGEFTSFQTPGRYVIRLDNGKESHPFEIGKQVYDAPLRAAIRFFYYQRNNTAIEMPYAEGPWVHAKDNKEVVLMPDGKATKTVRKGWHDAGDLAIYMPTHTTACYWLAMAWDDFRYNSDSLNIPESGDGFPDLLNELEWGIEWILDMQDQADGGFHANMCVRKDSPYGYGSTTPLTITGYELTNKTTAATAAAVGTLAYVATVFDKARFNPGLVERMKKAAVKGWSFLEAHPQQVNITVNCDNYQDPDDIHARYFAAVGMFLATGEEKYNTYVLANNPGSTWISDFNNQTNVAYLLYLKAPGGDPETKRLIREMVAARSRDAMNDMRNHPFGFAGYYYWGSLGTACARAGNYLIPDWFLHGNEQSMHVALQQLHYIFGQNSLGFVYLSGFGVHGMSRAFHHWLKTLGATPHNFPGMLAGGPNENPDPGDRRFPDGYRKPPETPIDERYEDNDSWSTNEIAVNQNAQLVYLLAAAQYYAHHGVPPSRTATETSGTGSPR